MQKRWTKRIDGLENLTYSQSLKDLDLLYDYICNVSDMKLLEIIQETMDKKNCDDFENLPYSQSLKISIFCIDYICNVSNMKFLENMRETIDKKNWYSWKSFIFPKLYVCIVTYNLYMYCYIYTVICIVICTDYICNVSDMKLLENMQESMDKNNCV